MFNSNSSINSRLNNSSSNFSLNSLLLLSSNSINSNCNNRWLNSSINSNSTYQLHLVSNDSNKIHGTLTNRLIINQYSSNMVLMANSRVYNRIKCNTDNNSLLDSQISSPEPEKNEHNQVTESILNRQDYVRELANITSMQIMFL